MSLLGNRGCAGVLVLGTLFVATSRGYAQNAEPSAPTCLPVRDAQGNLVTNSTCAPSSPTGPAAQRFPYPGETAPTPSTVSPAAPQGDAPQPTTPQAPAAQRFPFPGESETPTGNAPNAQAPGAPGGAPLQDAGSSGQSSPSSSSSSSSSSSRSSNDDAAAGRSDDPDANDPAAIPRSARHKLPPVSRQSPSEREQEDVQVAGFYFNDGNFRGAYDRAKDAVTLDADDAAAQLALANAARKLGKLDEAERAYKRCLELDPVPKVRKPAEKAIREMTGQS